MKGDGGKGKGSDVGVTLSVAVTKYLSQHFEGMKVHFGSWLQAT
jgi:hypothetical protein